MAGEPFIHELLEHTRERFLAHRKQARGRALILGVTGGVAAGKTTFAEALSREMSGWPERPTVEIVSTDGFLFPNKILAEKQLSYRKGFPESYDFDLLERAIEAIRDGRAAAIPHYSHVTYDVDPSNPRRLEGIDIAIIDGLHLGRARHGRDGANLIETLIYLDAPEADIEHWFRARLFPLMVAGRTDPNSFYFAFREMDDAAVQAFIDRVWTGINLPNLREHIVKDRGVADVIVSKARDHSLRAIKFKR